MKLNNKGFSLVEVLLAVAVSTIVFGAITALIVFASRSSKLTNEKITLQNEMKDAVNHIESYCMEAGKVICADGKVSDGTMTKVLIIFENKEDSAKAISGDAIQASEVKKITTPVYVYWKTSDSLYFGKCSDGGNVDLTSIQSQNMYLLAEHISKFEPAVNKKENSGKYTVDIVLEGKLNSSEYKTKKNIYLRNQ